MKAEKAVQVDGIVWQGKSTVKSTVKRNLNEVPNGRGEMEMRGSFYAGCSELYRSHCDQVARQKWAFGFNIAI